MAFHNVGRPIIPRSFHLPDNFPTTFNDPDAIDTVADNRRNTTSSNDGGGFPDTFNDIVPESFIGGGATGFNFDAFAQEQRDAFSSQQAQLGSSNLQSVIEQLASSGQLTPAALALLNQRSQRQQAGSLEQFGASLSQQGLQESQFGRTLFEQGRQFDVSQETQLFSAILGSGLDPEQINMLLGILEDFGIDIGQGPFTDPGTQRRNTRLSP